MQTTSGQEEIIEGVREELSVKLDLISIKRHDFVFRKQLIVIGGCIQDYFLMRVRITFKEKGRVVVKNVIIYPCDIVPYVRSTLVVIEKVVREKLNQKKSYKSVCDDFYDKGTVVGLNSIKSAVKRSRMAFARLVTLDLVEGIDAASWISREERSFAYLNLLYREALQKRNIFAGNLFR